MHEKVLNNENLIEFLNSFDIIKHKYFWNLDENDYNAFIGKKNNAIFSEYFDGGKRINFSNLEKWCDVNDIINTVYFSHNEQAIDYVNVIRGVVEKFINQYVDIENMDILFNHHFFNFEKMMHEEYRNNEKPYYRDHYIHQVRNMYEMFIILDDFSLYDNLVENQFDNNREIGKYLLRNIENSKNGIYKHDIEDLKRIVKDSKNDNQSYITDYLKHYIVYSTVIVSALLHDIGYPLEFLGRVGDSFEEFLPMSELFFESKIDISYIHDVLRTSLLFNIVPFKEIKERLLKHDHGALSSIVLLLFFYKSGQINTMAPVKRAVIELSAVVIYNHTMKYEFQTLKNENLYQNIYVKNPISYLFRLCDDIQEWQRIYYEITDKSNIFICPKCHMPMIKIDNNKKVLEYKCACEDVSGIRLNEFNYRRTMNAIACKEIKLKKYDENFLNIKIEYGLTELLQLSMYNRHYAHYRQSELFSLRRSAMLQKDLPYIYINGIVSYNPIYLKIQILKKYLEKSYSLDFKKFNYINIENIDKSNGNDLDKYKKLDFLNYVNNLIIKIIDEVDTDIKIEKNSIYEQIIKEHLKNYIILLFIGENLVGTSIKLGKITDHDKLNKKLYKLSVMLGEKFIRIFNIQGGQICDLLADYFYQKMNYISFDKYIEVVKNTSYNTNKVDEFKVMRCSYEKMQYVYKKNLLLNKVGAYTNYRGKDNDYYQYINSSDKKRAQIENYLDYFTDYYFFFYLSKCI